MPFFEAGPVRAHVQDLGTRLTLRLARAPDLILLMMGGFEIAVFLGLGVALAKHMVQSARAAGRGVPGGVIPNFWFGSTVLVVVATLMVAALGLVPLFFFLRAVAGDELVVLTPDSLTLTRRVLGLGRPQTYQRPRIRHLGAESRTWPVRTAPAGPDTLKETAWLQFVDDEKLVRFGVGLPTDVAVKLGELLRAHYPESE